MEIERVKNVYPKFYIIPISYEFLVKLAIHGSQKKESSFQKIARMCTLVLSLISLNLPPPPSLMT